MLHTGDEFEIRARIARQRELRAFGRLIADILFRPLTAAGRNGRHTGAANNNTRALRPGKDQAA